ncbi:site-specific DNA-methyltransferase [Selenomonas sp.]|uniref:site-specific DNA-methyltransferase n=1 Tax=Selenomonas sp. TaxID=2053611 RepID=UPI003FA1C145
MKKLAGESLNIMEENLAAMQQLFPEAFEEGKIDFDVLRQLLGDYVDDEEERYSFRWNGKGKALRLSQTPSTGTLRPCKEESKDWNTTENLYIEGDNLEVLKLLQKSYHGKVKMIYIDPPYNTGKDFVYKDDFRDNVANYKRITGQVDDEGHRTGTNSESNGRFHTDWLNMMYPRLRLARNLLSDDGVIFISIDDNEQGNLKKICDEVFGEGNFVASFPWRKRTAKSDVPFGVSQDYEQILCYVKSSLFVASVEGNSRRYYTTEDFLDRPWRIHDLSKQTTASERPNSFFTIVNPKTGKVYPANPNAVWRITKDSYPQYLEEQRIVFPGDYDFLRITKPVLRYWQEDDIKKDGENFGRKPVSTHFSKNIGMSQNGTKELTKLLEAKVFNFPKPKDLIQFLIRSSMKKNSIVLDFFSGSATTAHAVMNLNAEDGGNRRFILVQLPETTPVDSEARKAGYENICEIGKERIRRAGENVKAECEDEEQAASLDIGFKVFKLDSSNLQKWQPQPEDLQGALQESMDNFLPGRTELDVVYEIALKLGLDLSYEVEEREVDGQTIYIIGAGALMICLASPISTETAEALLKLHEEYAPETWQVVFRDTGFLSDQEKTNIKETLKSAGLDEDAFISI